MLTKKEDDFLRQSEVFLELALNELGVEAAGDLPDPTTRPPTPIRPTIIEDCTSLSDEEKKAIARDYHSPWAVAYFVETNPVPSPPKHPIFYLADQLREELSLHYPLEHPLEGHPEAVKRFGPADATVKVYNLDKAEGYREQGETAERFEMHHDGLGSGGTVQTAVLYCESGPLYGGYTYFQSILALAVELWKRDEKAFRSLFLPDALTIIRPRGKGALKVVWSYCQILCMGRIQAATLSSWIPSTNRTSRMTSASSL